MHHLTRNGKRIHEDAAVELARERRLRQPFAHPGLRSLAGFVAGKGPRNTTRMNIIARGGAQKDRCMCTGAGESS